MPTLRTPDLEAAVDAILSRAGERIVCGTPLGLGKPVPLLNALYARVKAQSRLQLSIITALSLEVPHAASELERRFLEPYARRAFAGVPALDYLRDLRSGGLPPNIELCEFYFRPGAMLGVPAAQQSYISSNYTHVARDMRSRGVNAVLVMVAERGGRYSLSCNPDLTLDVVRAMREDSREDGKPCVVAGLVNRNLPFMVNDAEVGEDYFDVLVDAPQWEHPLFCVPNPAVESADHAIGIHAAALVKDGGTLQLGIGSLGDAVAYWIGQRHADAESFAAALERLDLGREAALVDREGGRGPFREGLFASSEMFSWGLMTLYQAGVIRRRAAGQLGRGWPGAAGRLLPRARRVLPRAARSPRRRAPAVRHDLGGAHQPAVRRGSARPPAAARRSLHQHLHEDGPVRRRGLRRPRGRPRGERRRRPVQLRRHGARA